MEQNPQILKNTCAALQTLQKTISELETAANSALENRKTLSLDIKNKASRIEEIINTLNGAIK